MSCPTCGVKPGFTHYKSCTSIGVFITDYRAPAERVAAGVEANKRQLTESVSIADCGTTIKATWTGPDFKPHILVEAEQLIHGDRNKSYGHPWEDYERTVKTFNALTGHELTAVEGMTFMLCVKLSRQQNAEARDNLVDAAGYIGCIADSIDHYKETNP